jgi:hypothetical protein
LVDNYPTGQENAKQNHLIALCTYLITDKKSKDYNNALLRQWCCICLGLCWQNYPEAKWEGVRNNAHSYLIELVTDPVPEVRTAAIFALGTYIGCGLGNEGSQEQANKIDAEIVNSLIKNSDDIVFIVRKELIASLFNYVNQFIVQSNSNSNNSNATTNISSNQSSQYSSQASSNMSSNDQNPKVITKSHSSSVLSNSTQQQHENQR